MSTDTDRPNPETFHCRHCGAIETYDPPDGWYLLVWWQKSEAFDAQHKACRPPARQHTSTEAP